MIFSQPPNSPKAKFTVGSFLTTVKDLILPIRVSPKDAPHVSEMYWAQKSPFYNKESEFLKVGRIGFAMNVLLLGIVFEVIVYSLPW